MKLSTYLEKRGISQEQFAKSLEPPVSQGLVHQWISGKTAITNDMAKRIVKATDGEVTPHDCDPSTFPRGFEFPRAAA